jgi:hypothetical protein
VEVNFAYIPTKPKLEQCQDKTLYIFPPNQTLCKNLLATQTADHEDIKYLTAFREQKFQYSFKDFLRYVKEAISQDLI